MADFPTLSTGAVTQYPSTLTQQHKTQILRFVDGSEQRWPVTGTPARVWTLNMSLISEEELAAVEEFFTAQQGRFEPFRFRDPWDGTVYENCTFDADLLRSLLFDEDAAQTTLKIRTAL